MPSASMGATLPLLLSIPHGGTDIPEEVVDDVVASEFDVLADGDAFTAELYDLRAHVAHSLVATVARAFVDLNRAADDRPPENPDGVVKTQTVHGVALYRQPLSDEAVDALLGRYYHPYHERLQALGRDGAIEIGIDCHSMLAKPPPGFPNRGPRPKFCVSNGDGQTAPAWQLTALRDALRIAFELDEEHVLANDPFRGGHIIRHHSTSRVSWLQLEINRSLYLDPATLEPLPGLDAMRQRLLIALERFAHTIEKGRA